MESGSIERELYVDAAPEIVYEVLSSPEHIREWWSADTEFDAKPGATGSLRWTDEGSGTHQFAPFTVVDADPPRTFSFRWTYDEGVQAAPGNSLLASFELKSSGEGTMVRFRETGYRERGWEAAVLESHYKDHLQGWDFYLPRVAETAHRLALPR